MADKDLARYKFSKIPVYVYVLFALFFLFLVVLGYLSMFPFLSERKFRDAFHFSVYKRHKYAIEDMKQAIEYSAPGIPIYEESYGRRCR